MAICATDISAKRERKGGREEEEREEGVREGEGRKEKEGGERGRD